MKIDFPTDWKKVFKAIVKISVYILISVVSSYYLIHFNLIVPASKIDASNFATSILFNMPMLLLCVFLFLNALKQEIVSFIPGFLKQARKGWQVFLLVSLGIFLAITIAKGLTLSSLYAAIYYLIFIAFSEELAFRGFLYKELLASLGEKRSIIISGIIFGFAHSLFGVIVFNQDLSSLFSYVVGTGIFGTLLFAFLYKKSGSLLIPIMVHSILDNMTGLSVF
ncbi:MAG: CPBP family intramembrane metalloprotease [Coriobacteriales bacterium]|jgi:membrane protease YdiL (CAAX protease family)|nr:CPBP family intramembrane metalloprotease [Coriobacteriales bacterium]